MALNFQYSDRLSEERGITVRSVVLGLGAVIFINVWVTHSETVVHSTRLNLSVFQLPLLAVFVVLVGVVNPVVKRLERRFALSPSELLVVVAIGIVGAVVPTTGVTGFLIGILSSPVYFATPENGWAEYYHPHLAAWMAPIDAAAMRGFYEGDPGGVPWRVWLPPLFWWASFILASLALSASAMVMLRKQWAEHEKLVYPLVAVPVEMVHDARTARGLPGFMRGRLFWAGFAGAFALFLWHSLSWFHPMLSGVGVFPHGGYFRFTRYSPGIYIQPFQFFTIGFAYFANTQVLASIWVFYLLHVIQGGVFNRLGYQIVSSTDSFSADPPTEAYQCFGALAFLVVWRVWVARHHLRDVVLKALNRNYSADDRQEVLSYRTSLMVLLVSLVYVFFWLYQMGMDPFTAMLFMAGVGIIYLGIARVVAEAGVVYAGATVTPQAFAMDFRGTHGMTGRSLTAIALSYVLIDYMRGLFTPGLAHVVRIGDLVRGNRRALLLWVGVGVVAGLVASVWYTLHLAYLQGAYNFPRSLFFSGDPKAVFSSTLAMMRSPKAVDPGRVLFFGIGAGVMGLLTFLRYRFPWWPIHPIGLTLSAADNTKSLAMPVFIAWACKAVIMRIGGVVLYQKARPVFVGLLVGYTAGVVWCFVVDMIWFPGQGHAVHWW